MSTIERAAKGRFAKGGRSPNPGGRPRAPREEVPLPAKYRRAILRIANRKTEVKIGGKPEAMTLYEANVLGLATGNIQHRLASKNFIDLVGSAASVEHQLSRSERPDGDAALRASPYGGALSDLNDEELSSALEAVCRAREPVEPEQE